MGKQVQKRVIAGIVASVCALLLSGTASAHVVVKPNEAVTAGFQTFTMGVPSEKSLATVQIQLLIPAKLQHVSPTVSPGWTISTAMQGTGEAATVSSITWSGGQVPGGQRADFSFSAQAPASATTLQWKAYQTYADGSVVSWDQPAGSAKEEGGSKGPFSVTKVASQSAAATELQTAQNAAAVAKHDAKRAQTLGLAGLAVGLAALAITTRRGKQQILPRD